MADNKEEIKSQITAQEKMAIKFKSLGKDSIVTKLEGNIKDLKDKLKDMESPVKPKVNKAVAGSMTKEQCKEYLEDMRSSYLKSESTTKKNIKSGKAIADGSLKPSASLKNEAETIENKSEAGQKINKNEQKAIAFNI